MLILQQPFSRLLLLVVVLIPQRTHRAPGWFAFFLQSAVAWLCLCASPRKRSGLNGNTPVTDLMLSKFSLFIFINALILCIFLLHFVHPVSGFCRGMPDSELVLICLAHFAQNIQENVCSRFGVRTLSLFQEFVDVFLII